MLIRSQDKMQLIPFKEFVFTATKDGKIVCDKDIITSPNEMRARAIAEYSTKEKAIQVLDKIQMANFRVEKMKMIFSNSGKLANSCIQDFNFEMPQESEVE